MNGPRTNQFVAPTSFITSISRRRAKIESRMVFAISSAEAASRSTTTPKKMIAITCPTWRIRARSLAVVDLLDARRGLRRRSAAIASRPRPLRLHLERVGKRVEGQVLDQLRRALAHDPSASSLETKLTPPSLNLGSDSSWRARVPICCRVTAPRRCTRCRRRPYLERPSSRGRPGRDPGAEPIGSPSRNIPIRTVIVAATVVESVAVIERNASARSKLDPHSRCSPRAARRARARPPRARSRACASCRPSRGHE